MTSISPVLFIIFNRPDLTRRVFERIRQAQPAQLFIAADGPRPDVPEDVELCARARQVVEIVDWECDVHTLFRDSNLGCKQAVSSAIDWFFEHIDAGIILEDDCIPDPTFFRFSTKLLERYRHDERIMVISGNNFQHGRRRTQYSYYFSRYAHIWGWATWRRAWQYYDGDMKYWPTLRDTPWLLDILDHEAAATYWSDIFDMAYAKEIDSWDYPWTYSCWVQNGLTILPEVNLVSNIGFDERATHTKIADSRVASLPTEAIDFPLDHPPHIVRQWKADQVTFETNFQPPHRLADPLRKRAIHRMAARIPDLTKRMLTRTARLWSH